MSWFFKLFRNISTCRSSTSWKDIKSNGHIEKLCIVTADMPINPDLYQNQITRNQLFRAWTSHTDLKRRDPNYFYQRFCQSGARCATIVVCFSLVVFFVQKRTNFETKIVCADNLFRFLIDALQSVRAIRRSRRNVKWCF